MDNSTFNESYEYNPISENGEEIQDADNESDEFIGGNGKFDVPPPSPAESKRSKRIRILIKVLIAVAIIGIVITINFESVKHLYHSFF